MICPTGKVKYFFDRDSTRPKPVDEVICPSGSFPFVITGLDPVIHFLWKNLLRRMMMPGSRLRQGFAGLSSVGRRSFSEGGKSGHNECYRFTFRFFAVFFFADFFGTFAPSRLASDSPIAIACLRLRTLRPERPLFSVPALRSFIARSTLADAFFEYFRAMNILPVAGK
jgi:hypothetical protein